jgi:hypothetical protein
MDLQQQVLKEYKKDANQDIVLWLNSNAEVSKSASVVILLACSLLMHCISGLLLTPAPPKTACFH